MTLCRLADLPPPPRDKTGWPWTVESPLVAERLPNGAAWPKISIVTPSYNQGQFIEETIRSVLLQGYPNIEYIVMDGGSEDQTLEILSKYAPWLSYWKSEPDNGQVDALNRGFQQTDGELLNWLNSDDFLLPGALSAIANFWHLDNSIDLISGARVFRCPKGVEEIHIPWMRNWATLCLGLPDLAQEATFFSRRVWNKVGLLDDRFNYSFDVAFFVVAVKAASKIVLTTVPVATMNVHANQKTRKVDPSKSHEVDLLTNEYFNTVPGYPILNMMLRTRFHFLVKGALEMLVHRRATKKLLHGYYDHVLLAWTLRAFA